jgi:arylsulfatase A-like enzyme
MPRNAARKSPQWLNPMRLFNAPPILLSIAAIGVTLVSSLAVARAGEPSRPNILFLMADDWSWPHASSLGDPVIKTPTFDRVAREGVMFTNAHVACPSCTPSRNAIATGQWPWRLGDAANLGGSLRESDPTYPDLLHTAGYQIGFSSKGAEPSPYKFTHRDPFGPKFKSFEEFYAKHKVGEPFCFWFGCNDPHRPYRYEEGERSGLDPAKVKLPACLPDNETTRKDFCDYLFRTQRYDTESGKILALLEKSGELENTIVVMSGDNGLPFPRCKGTLYDTGTHAPLAIRWGAKVKGGRTLTDFVSLTDLAPTFLAAAGISPPPVMTGRSLLPILTSDKSGQADLAHRYVLTGMERHVFSYPCRAIRNERFSFIRNFNPADWHKDESRFPAYTPNFINGEWPKDAGAFLFNIDPSPTKQYLLDHRDEPAMKPFFEMACGLHPEEELYDLKSDPAELYNLAGEPRLAHVRANLRALLDSKLVASQDPRVIVTGRQVRRIEGWTVLISEDLLKDQAEATARAIELLTEHLKEIIRVVPAPAVAYVQTVPLWISPEYPNVRPHAEYHPDINWVRANGRDPLLAKGVEFTNVRIFEAETKRMPIFVLHELAHAYHDQVLSFGNAEIKAAYDRAKASGTYDKVERFNAPGRPDTFERAYAMTNDREYFAECTEAFFGRNDWFPFDRDQLAEHDPEMLKLLRKLWQVPEE